MIYRSKTGRVVPGVELRLVDDAGAEIPHDGEAVGEIEVRGPWITASYYNTEAPEKFHDGWLRTGDVGNIDARNYVQITDRSKDVIKSGGEWISSVELETLLVGHPAVAEAAVVGVPRRPVGGAAAGACRAQAGGDPRRPMSCAPSSRRRWLAGGSRSAGRSSTNCRRPVWASSTRS